jgi:hypothetical protein
MSCLCYRNSQGNTCLNPISYWISLHVRLRQSITIGCRDEGNITQNASNEIRFSYVFYYSSELNEQNNGFTADQIVELFKKILPDKQEQVMTFRE